MRNHFKSKSTKEIEMKNKIIFTILALIVNFSFTNSAHCQSVTEEFSPSCDYNTNDAYRYITFGAGPVVFIPNVGIGYRTRYSQFGWDTALSFSTIGYAHQLSAHWVGHYYLSPLRKNSAYVGLGLMGSEIFTNHKGSATTLSPDFVFGKELARYGNSKHFIEMHVAVPTLSMNSQHTHSTYLPLMYIKYGTAF